MLNKKCQKAVGKLCLVLLMWAVVTMLLQIELLNLNLNYVMVHGLDRAFNQWYLVFVYVCFCLTIKINLNKTQQNSIVRCVLLSFKTTLTHCLSRCPQYVEQQWCVILHKNNPIILQFALNNKSFQCCCFPVFGLIVEVCIVVVYLSHLLNCNYRVFIWQRIRIIPAIEQRNEKDQKQVAK